MGKITKRQGMMLCAAVLLVFMMMTVFMRQWGIDKKISQIHTINDQKMQKTELVNIQWEKIYPFSDVEDVDIKDCTSRTKKTISKNENTNNHTNKDAEWTKKHLLGYDRLVELGMWYEKSIDWNLIHPQRRIVLLEDGAWTFVYPKDPIAIQEKATSLIDLSQNVAKNGGKFLYVQAPFKVDPYGDDLINDKFDFSNQNCDALLKHLHANGITTLDLRQYLHRWAQAEHCSYHDFFFRTDHHWKPETALRAAKVVGNRLHELGIPVDDSRYVLQQFDVEILPDYFLGSAGKRATLARTMPDDFSILHPKFPTEIMLNIPEKNIHHTGAFELVYDKKPVERCDYYHLNPYAMYGYGDMQVMDIENLLMPPTNKKVLIIKDSFCDTMAPLLALGIRNLMTIDVRHFTGSVRTYIAVHKPDVVIVMYAGPLSGNIDWASHKDKFDFR